MNISRVFKFRHWPLWAKISAGLLVAVLVPVLIGAYIIENSFAAYSLTTEKDALAQTGKQQLKDLTAILDKADTDLGIFATSDLLSNNFKAALGSEGVTFSESRKISLQIQQQAI